MKINRILCCCMSGLGSSFLVEMNVKKVLQKLGMDDVSVNHAGVYDAGPALPIYLFARRISRKNVKNTARRSR